MSSTRPTVRHPDIIAAVSATPVAGNVYDKYGSANPVVRRLTASFLATLDELVADAAPQSVLDVGCGEGIVTRRIARSVGGRVAGLDVESPRLQAAWQGAAAGSEGAGGAGGRVGGSDGAGGRVGASDGAGPGVEYLVGDAQALPFADDEFDLVSLVEMLQLVEDPGRALAEAARVARRAVIVTVPREPLWRALNVARGAYVRELGNTPGHLHHWSRHAIAGLVSAHAPVVTVRSATPWTLILARPG
jgi:ubiquinone/menaquinone biosynthesis C-methylase UbiE